MAYFYYMDEPIRGWENPYFQDVNTSQPYSNCWENMYFVQEKYEIEAQVEFLTRKIEELENRRIQEAKAMHEAKWQPVYCSNCFSRCHLIDNYPYLSAMRKELVNPRVSLIRVLMITNQGYWLLMVKIELSDRLKLMKHRMKIFQALR